MMPPVVELRQYTLHPGRRDDLIALFEREFVESQEAVGIHLIGLFRDLDDPDRFVWLRGFVDMDARRQALEAFYFGPVWAHHRDAANATMIDSDNVLRLRPSPTGSGLDKTDESRVSGPRGTVLVGVHPLETVEPDSIAETLGGLDLSLRAVLVTEPAENSFPRLPVRGDGPFLVWLAVVEDDETAVRACEALTDGRLGQPSQLLRLAPTARSRIQV